MQGSTACAAVLKQELFAVRNKIVAARRRTRDGINYHANKAQLVVLGGRKKAEPIKRGRKARPVLYGTSSPKRWSEGKKNGFYEREIFTRPSAQELNELDSRY
ncbi:hypothetical protein CEXT_9711 [Caerostris extrusa]|uniref:Uncharacterized protein n=1 Tax=Caerostris extrusa TaxID=172846 RepID=A0AAV4TLR5_CAEEX|nr:hypothetical protein CEXT_9711 [Caerostris extrusa]